MILCNNKGRCVIHHEYTGNIGEDILFLGNDKYYENFGKYFGYK